MNLDPYLTPSAKINSKPIKDLHVKAETVKISEGTIGSSSYDIVSGKGFLGVTTKS